jgi:hypothetical protein
VCHQRGGSNSAPCVKIPSGDRLASGVAEGNGDEVGSAPDGSDVDDLAVGPEEASVWPEQPATTRARPTLEIHAARPELMVAWWTRQGASLCRTLM